MPICICPVCARYVPAGNIGTIAATGQTQNSALRPFIMRSDSELLIFTFRSEKKMGLLMQSDFAKSDGIKSDLRIR